MRAPSLVGLRLVDEHRFNAGAIFGDTNYVFVDLTELFVCGIEMIDCRTEARP